MIRDYLSDKQKRFLVKLFKKVQYNALIGINIRIKKKEPSAK